MLLLEAHLELSDPAGSLEDQPARVLGLLDA